MRMVFPNHPGRILDELSTDVNAFFESVLGEEAPRKPDYTPTVDFEDRDDSYHLSIDLPGVDPDQIHVDVEDEHVIIHGSRTLQDTEASGSETSDTEAPKVRRRVERPSGAFRRVLRLPKLVNRDEIVAKYQWGVLSVTLPKAVKRSQRIVVAHDRSAEAKS